MRHLDLIQGDEPLEEGAEDGGDEEEAEAEEAPDQQESEEGGAGESQVDARAEMDGEQADDGDTDPDAQEMEADGEPAMGRSEEHTSELQSLMRISYAVFCLKKNIRFIHSIWQLVRY